MYNNIIIAYNVKVYHVIVDHRNKTAFVCLEGVDSDLYEASLSNLTTQC